MARGNAMKVLRDHVAEKEAAVIIAADSWLPDDPVPGSESALAEAVHDLRAARKLLRQAEGE